MFLDARPRVGPARAAAWAAATLAAVALAVPAYLVIRPSRAAWWDGAEILGLTLFFAGTIPTLAFVFRGASGDLPPLPVIAALAVLQNAVFAGGALYIVRMKYRLPLAALGLTVGRWSRTLVQGARGRRRGDRRKQPGTDRDRVRARALDGASARRTPVVQRDELRTPVFRVLTLVHQPVELAAIAVLVGVIVPIGEELFFRGLVFGALRRRMNRHLAAFLSALFFAAAHLEPPRRSRS